MKYNKQGGNVKSSILIIHHTADKSICRVKSNVLYGLALGKDPTVPMGWASFSGKATYLELGWEEPIGNYEFIVYVENLDEPGTRVDRFWLKVMDKDNILVPVISMDEPAVANAEEIQGGNIVFLTREATRCSI